MKAWVNTLKIAIIEEDIEQIMALSENIPKTDDVTLANEACTLIEQAIALANQKKSLLRTEMNKLKTAQKYFK